MNYPAMRYVAERCELEGAPRAILWALSYRANREGEVWAGQRRIAREAGVSRKSVERWLPRFAGMGLLVLVEEGSGPQADRYRFSAELVDGLEPSSGDTVSPLEATVIPLVATSEPASGDMVSTAGELVATWCPPSGDMTSPLSSGNGSQGFEGSSQAREVQVVGGGSTADAAAADADELYAPVSEADKAYLRATFRLKSGQAVTGAAVGDCRMAGRARGHKVEDAGQGADRLRAVNE